MASAADNDGEMPRQVQRRMPRPERLFEQRKHIDRADRNHCTILEGVRRVDNHTLHVPGIVKIRTHETMPENFQPRSCRARERTPAP